jgi:hypothetical protein
MSLSQKIEERHIQVRGRKMGVGSSSLADRDHMPQPPPPFNVIAFSTFVISKKKIELYE